MLRQMIFGLAVCLAASFTLSMPVEAKKRGSNKNVSKIYASKKRAARKRANRRRAARIRIARRRNVRRLAARRAVSRRSVRRRSGAVRAVVDISSQRMSVFVNGRRAHTWRISSGKRGFRTPRGSYNPTRTYRRYYSKKYYNSPMPYSVFFRGGYAIHGTGDLKRLGRPASHGCIRLHPRHAANFYSLVNRYGKRRTRIVITR